MMARKLRFLPVGIPQHIIQRGNNRQVCFGSEEDFKAYLYWLKEFSQKYQVSIHAWVLMTNHVHLLCTAQDQKGISLMMQSLGRCYVRYFNYTYQRTGTLWEGRFKSCVVNAPEYLLHLYRYIELNPVRAKDIWGQSKFFSFIMLFIKSQGSEVNDGKDVTFSPCGYSAAYYSAW